MSEKLLQETHSLDQKIYKVKQLTNGVVTTIYVFNGKITSKNEEDLFQNIFTEHEIEDIKKNGIIVKFSDEQINLDDSIATIKIKILKELKSDICIDEIYLYCQKMETLNAVNIFQSLTQNGKLELTHLRLEQFISNIVSDENGVPFNKTYEDKEIYTYDDIFEMKFDNKKYIVNKVLGQKFFIIENEYPFVCNPYDVYNYDNFLEKTARKSLTTLNNHLLLNNGDIFDNNIYVCLAKDVLSFIDNKEISEESTMKIYYPFLYNKNINTLEDLLQKKEQLIENNKKILNEKVFESFKTIDMFYNVYALRTSDLNYIKKGIKYIKAVIRPNFDMKIPLEIIFKIIHATKDNPLIKYNPSSRQENIYRLFTDKIATDGRKIPFLKKATIFKLMKNIARNKCVAVYVESGEQSLVLEFDEEGYITIFSEFKNVLEIDEINIIFKESINPIIQEIKNILEQSGYKLNNFESLYDENIEIKQLTYETQILLKKSLNIEAYKGCISSVFINETNKFKGKTIHLRFKRVSNYSKFNSQEAFILEKSSQGLRGEEIIEALLENFPEDIDRKEAVEMVVRIANELEVEHGVRKSDIKIKNNPGFKTTIILQPETGIITITTENINNIYYLNTLPVYIDTMVRLTQDIKSTRYPISEIKKICSTGEKGELKITDIISSTEESVQNSEIVTIEDEDIIYEKPLTKEKPAGAMSLFFDEDDEDEDEDDINPEEFKGGINSDSSETSISSDNYDKNTKNVESDDSISSEKKISSDNELESFGLSENTPSSIVVDTEFPSEDTEEVIESEEESIGEEPIEEPEEESIGEESIGEESIKEPEEESIGEESIGEPIEEQEQESIKEPEEQPIEEQEEEPIEEPEEQPIEKDLPKEENYETKNKDFVSFNTTPSSYDKIPVLNINQEEPQEEDEEFKEPEEEDEFKEEESEVRNIDGMKLNKPYYFQTLIEKKDPILILKEDTPQFNSYPRTCSSNMRKQPVILTDNQLKKINKEHPGFLREEDVITYGSSEDKQFHYICPRYWCLKTNTVIDPKDLKEIKGKDGKTELIHPTCGKVLPKGEKKVKPGYYIYEFYSSKDNKKYPSLIPDSHPDGYCLPCCFTKYNTEGRIKAMKKCTSKENIVEEKETRVQDEYIKGPDKFPLDVGRWGYLPAEIQTMMHISSNDCQISNTNTNIKENHPCLLRHGIEINEKQSFISCISDLLYFAKKKSDANTLKDILSIQDMKEHIIQSISIDSFIKYQNGNLVNDFYNPDKIVDIKKYSSSKLFNKINTENQEENIYFTKVVSAFENFIDFLRDPEAFIDHTYLWDIISMPNQQLFPNGVNIIILQLNDDDITNNVSLLCPTNHYSSEFYQARKPTVILLKKDTYYEPIYSYTNSNTNGEKNILISKEFKEYDPKLSKTMRAFFKEIIKPFFNLICKPLDSMPNTYKAKRAILLYDLVQKLDAYEYTIKKLVINFNNKVIGVVAQEPKSDNIGFIPCYPSYLDENLKKDLDYVFMTDLGLWNTYENTIKFLNKLDRRSKKRRTEPDIPCKPVFKVIEDEHVVGVLTSTNQFIQLSQPILVENVPHDLDIPSFNNNNYILDYNKTPMIQSEVQITTQKEVDKERVDYIKRIRLETSFYNLFRNTIRILINDYENIKIREKIESEIKKEYIIYSEKLKNIDEYLRDLVKDKIQFIGDENYYKLINEVSTCIVKDTTQCNATPNLCAVTENGKCNMILPEKNLITKKLNEPIYFSRMADEFIRYNRIKSFMLEPQTYLSFGNIGYNLRDNEIILIQSLLTQEYFESLIPAVMNKYNKFSSYDEVEPAKTQVYDNLITSLDTTIERKNELICQTTIKDSITSSIWKLCFPDNYKEIIYDKNNICTFQIIIDLIERNIGEKFSISQIKNQLFDEYKKYLPLYMDKIVDILILEGKKTLGDQVQSGTLSFSNLIYTDNYFLTTFDLWLLVVKYKIPTIFISQKTILQTKYENHEFFGYGNREDDFAFIIIPGFRPENIPSYKLILNNQNEFFISLDKLNINCVERIYNAMDNSIKIEDYLQSFMKPKKTFYIKKKPGIIIESDSEDNNPKEKEKPKVQRKKKIIIEQDTPEEKENKNIKKQISKKNIVKEKKSVTKKNINK
jgi:hypothetical protein